MPRCALLVAALVVGCGTRREVTVRIRPPPMSDAGDPADGSPPRGPSITEQILRPGERCVVLAAAPLDSADTEVHATVYRTEALVADGARSCFGPAGVTLVDGLVPGATYLVEMVLLDRDDYAQGLVDPTRPRIVSLQDFPLPGNPEASYLCLSDPARSPVWRPILDRAAQLCRDAPVRPPCVLDMPVGGVCPAGSR